jgi:predicted ATP-grasp superfamily ATP-dependent carboligase
VASHDPENLAFSSKYCSRKVLIANPISFPLEALQDLIRLGKTFPIRPVLYYGDDIYLLFISRHRTALSAYYQFSLPNETLLENLTSKSLFAELAKRADLPIPKTSSSQEMQSAEDALKAITFPCIFKPHSHIGWAESSFIKDEMGKPYKAIKTDTPEQFREVYHKVKTFTDDFIIQEYIEGGEDAIYSFHAYCNRQSEPLAYYVGRKIRTYPIHAGESTFIELIHEPEVVRIGLEILKKIQFVGVMKIDFKKDAIRNSFYVLELNARYNLWNYLGMHCGINLPMLAYHDIVGESAKRPSLQKDYKTGMRWVCFIDDLHAFHDLRKTGQITFLGWVSSYFRPMVYNVFAWNDPIPFFVWFARAVLRKISKKAPVK